MANNFNMYILLYSVPIIIGLIIGIRLYLSEIKQWKKNLSYLYPDNKENYNILVRKYSSLKDPNNLLLIAAPIAMGILGAFAIHCMSLAIEATKFRAMYNEIRNQHINEKCPHCIYVMSQESITFSFKENQEAPNMNESKPVYIWKACPFIEQEARRKLNKE